MNNAVSRVAGLIAVALISTIVGGTLNLAGFRVAAVVTAALFIAGALVSWVGIRNPGTPQAAPEQGPDAA